MFVDRQLFKPKEDKDDSTKVSHEHSKALMTACKQIVDCLIENVLNLDGRGGGSSQRLIACLRTLHLFAKIKPQLLVEHAITLQPYLSLKCQVSFSDQRQASIGFLCSYEIFSVEAEYSPVLNSYETNRVLI